MNWYALVLAMVLLPSGASAQWYQWRDSNGTVHVSDQLATLPGAPVVCRGTACGVPTVAPAVPRADASPPDPRADELARREAQLASREAHLRLLRSSAATDDPARRELENLIEDEARADRAAIAALKAASGVQP